MDKFKFKFDKEKLASTVDKLGAEAKKMGEEVTIKAKEVSLEVGEKAKEGAKFVGEQYDKAKYDFDKARLAPVFVEDFANNTIKKPFVLRVVDYDKRLENEVCFGSIGFEDTINKEQVLNLYTNYALQSGITFYPCLEETIYCVDPYKDNNYICLDDYFTYLKKAKVNELEKIAYTLGAKHVRITMKEKKKTLTSKQSKGSMSVKLPGKDHAKANVEHSMYNGELIDVSVELDTHFNGGNPSKPEVVYFKFEDDITNLIEMRLSNHNSLTTKTYILDCSSSRDMKEKTAANIDAMLKKNGMSGNGSVVSEVEQQKRYYFEYTIEF